MMNGYVGNTSLNLVSADGGVDLWEDAHGFDLELEVIPKAGEIVYLVNIDAKEIYKVEVYAIGRDFFIPKNVDSWKPEWREVRFDDYGKRWFFELENAKGCLEGYLAEDEEIAEGGDDWWIAMKL